MVVVGGALIVHTVTRHPEPQALTIKSVLFPRNLILLGGVLTLNSINFKPSRVRFTKKNVSNKLCSKNFLLTCENRKKKP